MRVTCRGCPICVIIAGFANHIIQAGVVYTVCIRTFGFGTGGHSDGFAEADGWDCCVADCIAIGLFAIWIVRTQFIFAIWCTVVDCCVAFWTVLTRANLGTSAGCVCGYIVASRATCDGCCASAVFAGCFIANKVAFFRTCAVWNIKDFAFCVGVAFVIDFIAICYQGFAGCVC